MKKFSIFTIGLVTLTVLFTSCSNDAKKADELRLEGKYEEAFTLYQTATENGDAYSMWRLSKAYAYGQGIEINQEKALELLKQSAEKGCEEATMDMGMAYIHGYLNAPIDTLKGVDIIETIVGKSNNPYVLANYAFCVIDGIGEYMERNDEKALKVLESISNKEDPFYLYAMGRVYLFGVKGAEADGTKAANYLEKAFQKGARNAASLLGWMFLSGQNTGMDITKGIEWLKKGVGFGDAESMYRLALIYSSDDSAFQNYSNPKEALSLLSKAVKCGNADACVLLGKWYANGNNVSKDEQKAFELFQLADKYGSIEGTSIAARWYRNGYGCDINLEMAEKLFIKAAERKDVESAYLGLVSNYKNGTFPWNENNYKKYLEMAASQDYVWALYDLGWNYRNGGFGYPKDDYLAFLFFKKGADLGNEPCCSMVSLYYKHGIGCSKDMKKSKEYAMKAKNCK